ncbi:cysteine peptidase family C39 domain-containing protein [Budvicia diplopodorum]|uniref:cysteine peptidase family C39 domain-containing protein n=1 Tax=Budvicia diplopodorum TaxID=1119056 RepID=UPI0013573535|nr:cysteine peptidase family C39 domain-containing protein [Budvicia diplopodorum]
MVNPSYYAALVLSPLLFFTSAKLLSKIKSRSGKRRYIAITFMMALISLSIPAAYLSDAIGEHPGYAQFRVLAYSELLVCLSAPFVGVVGVGIASVLLKASGKRWLKRGIYLFCLFTVLGYTSLPFVKQLAKPRPFYPNAATIGNRWIDGIALQTTPSTCGPASLATILARYGSGETEANIAEQAYSSSRGTENWYLARYAAKLGYRYHFLTELNLAKVPTPSIIGVNVKRINRAGKPSRAGHFITLLDSHDGYYLIADSLSGLHRLTAEQFDRKYYYRGFVLHISKADE